MIRLRSQHTISNLNSPRVSMSAQRLAKDHVQSCLLGRRSLTTGQGFITKICQEERVVMTDSIRDLQPRGELHTRTERD